MMKYPRWVTSTAISAGILGLAVAGVSAVLAHRIVNALTRPHQLLDEIQEQWQLPQEWEVSLAHGEFEPPSSCHRSLLFCASDGPLLRGDFWAQAQPAPTIVICHGYRMSRAHLRPLAALEYSLGYNVLLFDFRGHGDSEPVITRG